jgi:hypothetical protein
MAGWRTSQERNESPEPQDCRIDNLETGTARASMFALRETIASSTVHDSAV